MSDAGDPDALRLAWQREQIYKGIVEVQESLGLTDQQVHDGLTQALWRLRQERFSEDKR